MLILSLFAPTVYAGESFVAVLFNDAVITFPDEKPFIDDNGRIQIPARIIGEKFKASRV